MTKEQLDKIRDEMAKRNSKDKVNSMWDEYKKREHHSGCRSFSVNQRFHGFKDGFDAAVELLMAENARYREALEKAKQRNHALDVAMSHDKSEMAQEIWRHQMKEINEALHPCTTEGEK